jgi:uncharacterized membrane protein (DUF106 family)
VTAFFDGLIGIFGGMHPLVGLSVVSIITGGVMLVVWKFTSNQKAIADAKAKISAYILEIRLFQEDLGLQFAAQGKALRANLKYMSLALPPMLVVLIPVVIILVQLDVRYQRRPLLPGETTLLKVELAEKVDPADLTLTAPDGIAVETPPMRMERVHEVDWRIRAEKEGSYELAFHVNGTSATKKVVVGDKLTRIAEGRDQAGILGVWLAPAEAPLPKDSPFRAIFIDYPDREMTLYGVGLHWLLVFFVVSVAFGFAIKGVVGVEV